MLRSSRAHTLEGLSAPLHTSVEATRRHTPTDTRLRGGTNLLGPCWDQVPTCPLCTSSLLSGLYLSLSSSAVGGCVGARRCRGAPQIAFGGWVREDVGGAPQIAFEANGAGGQSPPCTRSPKRPGRSGVEGEQAGTDRPEIGLARSAWLMAHALAWLQRGSKLLIQPG